MARHFGAQHTRNKGMNKQRGSVAEAIAAERARAAREARAKAGKKK